MKQKSILKKLKKINPFYHPTWQEKLLQSGLKILLYLAFFVAGYFMAKLQSLYRF